ncbi:MAG: AAA family ATPase, partial [Vicinamibacteria bacterium]
MSQGSEPPLRVLRADEIDPGDHGPSWLIEALWPHAAVAVIGGQPKSWKTWLGLDVAVSVASGTPCLGRFAVPSPGSALVYLAEDALRDVRKRIECLARSRGLALDRLDLHIIAEPTLRLDQDRDRRRLQAAVASVQPKLLLLDPLVRLHQLDENSSQEISNLLGYLRALQREHDLAVALAHHTAKRAHARHGQALRGSGDIHAWTDVGLYLTWQGDRLYMTTELRTAKPPDPLELRLVDEDAATTHLAIVGGSAPET